MTAADRPRVGGQITSAEQLDALPVGTVVMDSQSGVHRRHRDGGRDGYGVVWMTAGTEDWNQPIRMVQAAPLTVLYVPGEQPRPSVTDNARAEAVAEVAEQIDRLYRDGLVPKSTVLADLAEWAVRMRQGRHANGHTRAAGRAETSTEQCEPRLSDHGQDRHCRSCGVEHRAETATATLMARRGGKTQALIESLLAQASERGLTVEVVYPETTTASPTLAEISLRLALEMDCERVYDDNANAYYCNEHDVGWLMSTNQCARAERLADAVLGLLRGGGDDR